MLVGDKLYSVIGAVSASHTILNIGEEPSVKVGDEAILVGPDHDEIHPNYISKVANVSVYDILMHMSAKLPKFIT
jgi:alanine racemase